MPTFKIGSGVGDNYATFLFPVPDVDWFKSALFGALFEMTNPDNWIEMGDVAVSFAVEESARMIANYKYMAFNPFPIGMVFPFAGGTAPDGYKVCNGDTYSAADYPELFAAIGYTFGGGADDFQVPNLVNRVVVGSGGDFSLADVGGEQAHQLTESELASHVHSIGATITTPVLEPGEVPALTPIPIITSNTGSAGSDVPHNNMQPYQALNYIIYAGRL